ncbi:hypothetical protein CVT24_011391 [Panaeolus cyanescens]|uniref:Reverse transcriptase domain-containing protein n=1 Tax=Panaeolus cyanescens TaxID=181874 RepID=A0A409YGK6_9AGAR|nr:hypothetical protein CVT24_011391 [Panaeolus cyanescens]
MPWKQSSKITILGIYAPNDTEEQIKFWDELTERLEHPDPIHNKPDIMLGDFNMVEGSIDREPQRLDNQSVTERLQNIKENLRLQDSWQNDNPATKEFTYYQKSSGSQSRIDRIYLTEALGRHCHSWENRHSGLGSDHKLLTVRIENKGTPHIGRGRWQMPHNATENKHLIREIKKRGAIILQQFREAKDKGAGALHALDPQQTHECFKKFIKFKTQEYLRATVPKVQRYIEAKETELKTIIEQLTPEAEQNRDLRVQMTVIEEELSALYTQKHNMIRNNVMTKYWIESETIGKTWINANKEVRPKETIYRLKRPTNLQTSAGTQIEHTEYVTRSDEMANLAARYHDDLQKVDIDNSNESLSEQQRLREQAFSLINRTLDSDDQEYLKKDITEEEIAANIRHLATGKSPGPDGIPVELYKTLLRDSEQYKAKEKTQEDGTALHQILRKIENQAANEDPDMDEEEPHFNITEYLQILYNDIHEFGPNSDSCFAEGWMCLLYKKGDRTDIANYRPITVLNSDYKILTRAMTTRLGNIAGKIIHPDQAGFMKGWHIEDHTDLVHMLMHLCETKEINGAIVCLDQEKAYDRINHTYLWEVLHRFGVPQRFIDLVQSLYSQAHTRVIINGVQSNPYKVTRGVRQGDPLSCLLFNLAIEPLAESLRNSNLKGIQIGDSQRLIASLFADDTTVYLSESDDVAELFETLTNWCKVSGAKFNKNKTEIIPIGSPQYRNLTSTRRSLNEAHKPIDNSIRISTNGDATRILGAWVGYKIDEISIWNKLLDEINNILRQWEKGRPTLEGRRLIVAMYIAGKTQFLTRVQGMPKQIEDRLQSLINRFMWGKVNEWKYIPTIRSTILTGQIESGGRKSLDIAARNEAIDIIRVKTYLKANKQRPTWTRLADEIISLAVNSRSNAKDPDARTNTFLQDVKPGSNIEEV